MNQKIIGSLVAITLLLPTTAMAGNLKKQYINLNQEGSPPTVSDLPANYATTLTSVQTNMAQDRVKGSLATFLGGVTKVSDSEKGKAVQLNGTTSQYVKMEHLDVNTTAGAKNTVTFWMKWDGPNTAEGNSDSDMPFGWNTIYDLWLNEGYFGFNTSSSLNIGISSQGLANRWVHVAAVFVNGTPTTTNVELYIDGKKQTLSLLKGSTNNVTVTPTAMLGTWGANFSHMFKGKLTDVTIWNRALTEAEVLKTKDGQIQGNEEGLIGYWKMDE